ncbi:tRNA pseudouridine synthase, putative [Trypanosoma cruzi marinkellei]|uniref:tRNA pseudouridine synthase, putative n=1 Tax=Trypanosoma cruzi marinkellei TaxID=85056 RepID=K2NGH3_TRYCR|nr:tRNA pseudouridine synthase, putative [Trypanosoma cruzi marinkellei]
MLPPYVYSFNSTGPYLGYFEFIVWGGGTIHRLMRLLPTTLFCVVVVVVVFVVFLFLYVCVLCRFSPHTPNYTSLHPSVTLRGMRPLAPSRLWRNKTAWIWTVDKATLHAIDFLAYRLGLFHPPPGGTGCGAATLARSKGDRLNILSERSSVHSSFSPVVRKQQTSCGEICFFSSLDTMKRMMREWERRERKRARDEEEMAIKEEADVAAKLHHPEFLFSDEDSVLLRFGMGGFASPTAPGFFGLFRQHWKDFIVTEMVTDAAGLATAISREHDWSIPALPPSLLNATETGEQGRGDGVADTNKNEAEGEGRGDVGPSSSFFTVDVEERVAVLLKEGSSEENPLTSVEPEEEEKEKEAGNNDCVAGKRDFYLQCYLHKRHVAHSVALANIAQTLRMHPSGISVAGIKDYIGDTIQRVRLKNITPAAALEANRFFRMKKWSMTLSDFSYQNEPLVPGRLFGNHFRIVLREVTAAREDVERALHAFEQHGFPNYYGCQRFSWFGGKNDAAFALLHHNWLVFAFRFLGYTNCELTLRELLQREKKYPNPLQDEYRRNVVRRLRRIATEPTELDVAPFLSCPPLGAPPTSADGGPISDKQELIIFLQLREAFFDLNARDRRLTAQRLSSYLWNQVLTLRLHHFGLQVLVGDIVLPETFRCVAALPVDRTDCYREGIRVIADEEEKSAYTITDVMHPGFSFNAIRRPMNTVGEYYLQVCGKYHLDWHAHHAQTGIYDFLEPPRPIIRKPINLRHEYNKAESTLTLEFVLERGSYANVAISELMKLLRCAGSESILLLPAPEGMWDIGSRDPGYVKSMQDIYSGFEDGLGFVTDEHDLPLVGEGKVWDHDGPLFLPDSADPVKKAYRWGEQHLLRNIERRERDEEAMKMRLFEKPLAKTLKDGEVAQYAGHTVPMLPNSKAKRVFFKVLRRQRRFPCAPKTVPRIRRGAEVRNRTPVNVPFKTINRNTWNVTW